MGDGTKKNPFTRDDVIELLKNNIKHPEDSNFSDKYFQRGIDLSGLNLDRVCFKDATFKEDFHANPPHGAIFCESSLKFADFRNAELEYADFSSRSVSSEIKLLAADFRGANLRFSKFNNTNIDGAKFGIEDTETKITEATLDEVDFRGASLNRVDFRNCYFYGTKLEGTHIRGINISKAHLDDIDWGNFILADELNNNFDFALNSYREMNLWYSNAGYNHIAADFYYRQKETDRKKAQYKLKNNPNIKDAWSVFWLWFYKVVCGYGEKTFRIVCFGLFIILLLALMFFLISATYQWSSFWRSLYFSAVSFTALGYGNWINTEWLNTSNDWIRGLGALESFIGVFTMSLFLVSFTRKMTR